MHIVVNATAQQKEYLASLFNKDTLQISWISQGENPPSADAYFDWCFEENGYAFSQIIEAPVLVNAVITKASELPSNSIRFNGWQGFIQRGSFEVAASNEIIINKATAILREMGFNVNQVPDELGLISARVLAMIINEAYFGLGEKISSKKDIDTAMKLGTNYPFGPFEWGEMIGLSKIAQLLTALGKISPRYVIAPALLEELNNK